MRISNLVVTILVSLTLAFASCAEEKKDAAKDAKDPKNLVAINKMCPVEGGEVDAKEFVVYKEKKVAFCCAGCDKEFNKDPEKFMKVLVEKGDDNTVKKEEKKEEKK